MRLILDHTLVNLPIDKYRERVSLINQMINEKKGAGNDYLGWADYPLTYDKDEFNELIKTSKYIRENFDTLVVCGIGGSYLGARAALEALKGFYNKSDIEIIFIGQTFSPTYTKQVLSYLEKRNFAINVISKSGTTTETAIAFRLLRQLLENKVGKKKAKDSIFVTTDAKKGALKELSNKEGYKTFVLPGDVGGRFSVLTPVGLLPLSVAGVDIKSMMAGALKAREDILKTSLEKNDCYLYACMRDFLYRNNYSVELYAFYEPHFAMLGEWLKQLYGESEGKNKKGLFPGSVTFSTDLHSLGQFIQDGTPLLFETVIYVNEPLADITIPSDDDNFDGLNYLSAKPLSFVNMQAFKGTLVAHVNEGKVPNIVIEISHLDAFKMGYLFYFFMRSCAMSAYLLEVNPFNQPGVEVYKRNMFKLLGKKD